MGTNRTLETLTGEALRNATWEDAKKLCEEQDRALFEREGGGTCLS